MGHQCGKLSSKFMDNMDKDGFVRKLNMFGHIYDSGGYHGFRESLVDWFRDKGTLS
jgi:hypothetical protein